jgi:hypothetical protein
MMEVSLALVLMVMATESSLVLMVTMSCLWWLVQH